MTGLYTHTIQSCLSTSQSISLRHLLRENSVRRYEYWRKPLVPRAEERAFCWHASTPAIPGTQAPPHLKYKPALG